MNKYNNSKIYKLVSDHTDEIYYGSTVQKLCHRLSGHSRDFREGKNHCTCKKLFELGKVIIVLVESVNVETKEELHARERFYIENNKCVNKCIPNGTKEEWYQKNKELTKERSRKRYENKKEEIKIKDKEYKEKNKEKIKARQNKVCECECGHTYTHNHKSRHLKTKKHLDNI